MALHLGLGKEKRSSGEERSNYYHSPITGVATHLTISSPEGLQPTFPSAALLSRTYGKSFYPFRRHRREEVSVEEWQHLPVIGSLSMKNYTRCTTILRFIRVTHSYATLHSHNAFLCYPLTHLFSKDPGSE